MQIATVNGKRERPDFLKRSRKSRDHVKGVKDKGNECNYNINSKTK